MFLQNIQRKYVTRIRDREKRHIYTHTHANKQWSAYTHFMFKWHCVSCSLSQCFHHCGNCVANSPYTDCGWYSHTPWLWLHGFCVFIPRQTSKQSKLKSILKCGDVGGEGSGDDFVEKNPASHQNHLQMFPNICYQISYYGIFIVRYPIPKQFATLFVSFFFGFSSRTAGTLCLIDTQRSIINRNGLVSNDNSVGPLTTDSVFTNITHASYLNIVYIRSHTTITAIR